METIPQDAIDRMMVKYARRCCICRRFRPTRLQVHHIVERNQGGTDDEDNLIVICLTCHSDVHSQVPFTRRFSIEELKGHRDTLLQMLAQGALPADEQDDAEQLTIRLIGEIVPDRAAVEEDLLSHEATELLLAAAHTEGNHQGMILLPSSHGGDTIIPGNRPCPYERTDRRAQAKYKGALDELQRKGLIE